MSSIGSDDIIIGGKDTPISKILTLLMAASSFALFHEKWTCIAIHLDTPRELVKKLQSNFLLGTLSLADLVLEVIEEWVGRKGTAATLQRLLAVLTEAGLKACAETLEEGLIQLTKVDLKKYCCIPLALKQFLSSRSKSICILSSPDTSITCEKIRENSGNFLFHDFETFLKIVSSPMNKKEHVHVVMGGSIEHLKQILIAVQHTQKIRVVIVTERGFENAVEKLLTLNKSWKKAIQISSDKLDWADLTPAYMNTIVRKLEEEFKIELQQEEFGLKCNERLLLDLVKGNNLKIFKQTIPEKLSYYISRTLMPRNYISPKIFEQTSNDVFLFSGMERHELSQLVKFKITDNSTNQMGGRGLTTKYIILDHPTHFEKIGEKTIEPVHLLHYENNRFRWITSKGEMKTLRNCVDASLEVYLDEENFCLDMNSIQPVIISDAPGMGKSTLLAQIGNRLKENYPERSVFYIELSEFVKQMKTFNHLKMEVAIHKVLKIMTCKNFLGGMVLQSKLNSNEHISIELLLDGFDEIDSVELKLANEILETMQTSLKLLRIWITSRSHFLPELETRLNTFGYNIQPFNEDNQLQFLKSFWSRGNQLDEKKMTMIGDYAKECLQILEQDMNSKKHDIAGIPLQCMLIAEVYEEEALNFANNGFPSFQAKVGTSISDLYKYFFAKKIQKYLTVHIKEDFAGNQALMDIHARLALELIFPNCIDKFRHLLPSYEIGEVLKIGIVQASSGTSQPSFIHRTFAEYCIAWFVVDKLDRIELHDFFIKEILDCKSPGVAYYASAKFNHLVITYFLNDLIGNVDVSSIDPYNFSVDECIMQKIAICCTTSDFVKIFKFFSQINAFDRFLSIFHKELLLHAIDKSSVEIVQLVFRYFELQQTFEIRLQIDALRQAVRRGLFSVVEFLVNEKQLRRNITALNMKNRFLLHDCVENSNRISKFLVDQKVQVMKLLVSINPQLLEERDGEGNTTLLCQDVHWRLLTELLELNANAFAKNKFGQTILHCVKKKRLMLSSWSNQDYHRVLSIIPNKTLEKLVQEKDEYGMSPLLSLLQFFDPDPQTLDGFKNCNADFNCLDKDGLSVIRAAIQHGRNSNTLQKLVECGAKIDWKGTNGESLLHLAAHFGNKYAVDFFVNELGVDINTKDKDDLTPLDYVINSDWNHNSRVETATAIKHHGGCFKETSDIKGQSQLHIAAKTYNLQSILSLIELGIDVNEDDEEGNTPLHLLMQNDNFELIWLFRTVPFFLDHSANPNAVNKAGETPLHILLYNPCGGNANIFTILKGKTDITWTPKLATLGLTMIISENSNSTDEEFYALGNELIENGADLNYKDFQGDSFLHIAALGGQDRALRWLVEKGVKVNATNNTRRTTLHVVARETTFQDNTQLETIKFLIDHGADVYARDKDNRNFLQVYMNNMRCTFDSHIEISNFQLLAEYLVNNKLGAIFNVTEESKATLFQLAIRRLDINEETLALFHSIPVDFNAVDKNGDSVLTYAIRGNRSTEFISNLIIKFGTDPKILNKNSDNLLHITALCGRDDVLEVLLNLGKLDINHINSDGNAPIHSLKCRNELQMYELLKSKGADVLAVNKDGYTAKVLLELTVRRDIACLFEKWQKLQIQHPELKNKLPISFKGLFPGET